MIGIEDLISLSEPLKTFQFETLITNLQTLTGQDPSILRLHVNNCTIPGFSQEPIEVVAGGHVVKYPGRGMYPRQWTCEFREHENQYVYRTLQAWRNLLWNPLTGVGGRKADVSSDIYVYALDTAKVPKFAFYMYNCYPENVSDVPLDNNSSGVLSVQVTFSYDYATIITM